MGVALSLPFQCSTICDDKERRMLFLFIRKGSTGLVAFKRSVPLGLSGKSPHLRVVFSAKTLCKPAPLPLFCYKKDELLRAMLEKRQVFAQTLDVWSGAFILALDTTKASDGGTSSHILTIDGWQTINLDNQNYCPCQFGVEFLIIWTCTKIVRQFILIENALYSLILQKHWC